MSVDQLDQHSIVEMIGGAFMAMLAWFGRKQLNRLDKLEDQSVTKEDFKDTLMQLRTDRHSMHQENQQRLERIEGKLDLSSILAIRLARAEQDVVDLREWKHLTVDPYVGATDVLKDRVDRIERHMDDKR